MDIQKLKEELTLEEGCEFKLYNDHLGYKTFGIGHLVTKDDPEYEMEIGEEVSEERVNELFAKDIETTISECKELFENFDNLTDEVQKILANMMFNLGRPRLSKFRKLCKAVADKNWQECAVQMEDSRWHKQVTNRANRLISRMKSVDST